MARTRIPFDFDTEQKLSSAMKIHAKNAQKKVPVKIHVDEKTHTRMKITAARLGVSMSDFVGFCIDGFMTDFVAAAKNKEKEKRAEKGALPDPELEEDNES